MGTFQPLYYSGGRYTSSTDRKLLSALINAESDGKRIAGVIAAGTGTASMRVTATSPNTVSVAPGLCVIPDSTTPTVSSGLYLAGVTSTAETAYFPTNGTGQKTHTVYAVLDDTPYTIINKCIVSNKVTMTTSAPHGFADGQTVVITGVDDIYNGSYVLKDCTSTTFSYDKTQADEGTLLNPIPVVPEVRIGNNWAAVTNKLASSSTNLVTLNISNTSGYFNGSLNTTELATVKGVDSVIDGTYVLASASSTQVTFYVNKRINDISSTAVSNSSLAVARVPFKIAVELQGGTVYATKTKLELATITLASGANIPSVVTDKRIFTAASGGVHLYYDGAAPAAAPGRLRYNLSQNKMQFYTTSWNNMLELDGTLTDSTKAAPGNHNHDSLYTISGHTHSQYSVVGHTHTVSEVTGLPGTLPTPVSAGFTGSTALTLATNTSFTNIAGLSVNLSFTTITYALVEYAASILPNEVGTTVYIGAEVSGATTYSAEPSYGSSTGQSGATDGTAYDKADWMTAVYGSSNVNIGYRTGARVIKFNSGNSTVTLRYKTSSGGTGSLYYANIKVIPLTFGV